MSRLLGSAVILLTLLTPLALAQSDVVPEPRAQPQLPDLAPIGDAIASGAAQAGEAASDAAGALASGVVALAKGIGRGVGAAAVAIGHALTALGKLLGAALVAIGHGLAALAGLLAALGLKGARFVAAHPRESAIVGGAATGVGMIAWATKKWWLSLFVPLYSRLARSEMLDNKVRASVFEHVKANPGAHPSAIAETLGLGWGTIVYHLARLEDASLVTTREAHNRKCYFAVGGDLDNAGRTAVAAMSTDKARAIVDILRASPGISQKELAEKLGISQALASWHIKRLIASGVLVSTRAGRSNLLHVAEHVPVVTPAPVALAA